MRFEKLQTFKRNFFLEHLNHNIVLGITSDPIRASLEYTSSHKNINVVHIELIVGEKHKQHLKFKSRYKLLHISKNLSVKHI